MLNCINNPLIFYPLAILMLMSAILFLKLENIFYSLLTAIVVFFLTGFLFYVLGSEYNAVIQIIIYGIAIPVILALSVMFTDTKKYNKRIRKKDILFYFIHYFIWLILIIGLAFIMKFVHSIPDNFNLIENFTEVNPYEIINIFGNGIYKKYVLSFEFMSGILLIVIMGIALLNNKGEQV